MPAVWFLFKFCFILQLHIKLGEGPYCTWQYYNLRTLCCLFAAWSRHGETGGSADYET